MAMSANDLEEFSDKESEWTVVINFNQRRIHSKSMHTQAHKDKWNK